MQRAMNFGAGEAEGGQGSFRASLVRSSPPVDAPSSQRAGGAVGDEHAHSSAAGLTPAASTEGDIDKTCKSATCQADSGTEAGTGYVSVHAEVQPDGLNSSGAVADGAGTAESNLKSTPQNIDIGASGNISSITSGSSDDVGCEGLSDCNAEESSSGTTAASSDRSSSTTNRGSDESSKRLEAEQSEAYSMPADVHGTSDGARADGARGFGSTAGSVITPDRNICEDGRLISDHEGENAGYCTSPDAPLIAASNGATLAPSSLLLPASASTAAAEDVLPWTPSPTGDSSSTLAQLVPAPLSSNSTITVASDFKDNNTAADEVLFPPPSALDAARTVETGDISAATSTSGTVNIVTSGSNSASSEVTAAETDSKASIHSNREMVVSDGSGQKTPVVARLDASNNAALYESVSKIRRELQLLWKARGRQQERLVEKETDARAEAEAGINDPRKAEEEVCVPGNRHVSLPVRLFGWSSFLYPFTSGSASSAEAQSSSSSSSSSSTSSRRKATTDSAVVHSPSKVLNVKGSARIGTGTAAAGGTSVGSALLGTLGPGMLGEDFTSQLRQQLNCSTSSSSEVEGRLEVQRIPASNATPSEYPDKGNHSNHSSSSGEAFFATGNHSSCGSDGVYFATGNHTAVPSDDDVDVEDVLLASLCSSDTEGGPVTACTDSTTVSAGTASTAPERGGALSSLSAAVQVMRDRLLLPLTSSLGLGSSSSMTEEVKDSGEASEDIGATIDATKLDSSGGTPDRPGRAGASGAGVVLSSPIEVSRGQHHRLNQSEPETAASGVDATGIEGIEGRVSNGGESVSVSNHSIGMLSNEPNASISAAADSAGDSIGSAGGVVGSGAGIERSSHGIDRNATSGGAAAILNSRSKYPAMLDNSSTLISAGAHGSESDSKWVGAESSDQQSPSSGATPSSSSSSNSNGNGHNSPKLRGSHAFSQQVGLEGDPDISIGGTNSSAEMSAQQAERGTNEPTAPGTTSSLSSATTAADSSDSAFDHADTPPATPNISHSLPSLDSTAEPYSATESPLLSSSSSDSGDINSSTVHTGANGASISTRSNVHASQNLTSKGSIGTGVEAASSGTSGTTAPVAGGGAGAFFPGTSVPLNCYETLSFSDFQRKLQAKLQAKNNVTSSTSTTATADMLGGMDGIASGAMLGGGGGGGPVDSNNNVFRALMQKIKTLEMNNAIIEKYSIQVCQVFMLHMPPVRKDTEECDEYRVHEL